MNHQVKPILVRDDEILKTEVKLQRLKKKHSLRNQSFFKFRFFTLLEVLQHLKTNKVRAIL